jgi:GNAT superfamily N-acetyltransferase
MSDMIVVRRPAPTDAVGVGRAWEDARQFYSDLDSRTFLPPDPADRDLGRAIVEKLIATAGQPNRWIRIAEVDGEAVGFITATLHEPVEDASRDIMRDSTRRHIKIDTLVVQRSRWRAGVGKALVNDVEDWAKHEKASLLKVGTYAGSTAVAFYEALGYDHRSIIFEKYLD